MLIGSRKTDAAAHAPITSEHAIDRVVFPSTDIAGKRAIRFARGAVLISVVFFAAVAPYAKTQLGSFAAFIPIYTSTLVICDVITAVLLFSQFYYLGTWSLLILADAYAFTAAITLFYTVMFPGLFTPSGLLGAGPQSTSAMYIFWHGGFPVLMIAYALLKRWESRPSGKSRAVPIRPGAAILASLCVILATVSGYTIFATAGSQYLPVFLIGDHTTDFGRRVLSADWVVTLFALFLLWRRRSHTVIDVWLIVVLSAWLFDFSLSAILNAGRYDLGWYFGRIYGLLAASFLLVVLLVENSKYYARLVLMAEKLRSANLTLERLSQVDGLTNVANRRFFDAYLVTQMNAARRSKQNLALILWDVDAFKAYNDHYGHQAGDECLKRIVGVLESCCQRPLDIVARFGGEEFAMILPDTSLAGARHVAETAQAALAKLNIPHEYSPTTSSVSISGGVAVMSDRADTSAEQIVAAADASLYEAKRLGRNRFVCLQGEPEAERDPARKVTLRSV